MTSSSLVTSGRTVAAVFTAARVILSWYGDLAASDYLSFSINLCQATLVGRSADVLGRVQTLELLASALRERFLLLSDQDDLEQAISLFRQSLRLREQHGLPTFPSSFNLGRVLFGHFATVDFSHVSLQESARHLRHAYEQTSPGSQRRAEVSIELSHVCAAEYHHVDHNVEKMEEAMTIIRGVIPAQASDPLYIRAVCTLASNLLWKFLASQGTIALVHEAISLFRDGLTRANPPRIRDRTLFYAAQFGLALRTRFAQEGNIDDIDEGIQTIRNLLSLTAPTQQEHRSGANALSALLFDRYRRTGRVADLEECDDLARIGFEPVPGGSVMWVVHGIAWANKVADRAREAREQGWPHQVDIQPAIAFCRTPLPVGGGLYRFPRLHCLSRLLMAQFHEDGDVAHLIAAQTAARKVFEAAMGRERPNASGLLGHVLLTLSKQRPELSVIDEACSCFRRSLELVEGDHLEFGPWCQALGETLYVRYSLSRDNSDLLQARVRFGQALEHRYTSAQQRTRFAKAWVDTATTARDQKGMSDAYAGFVALLPRAVMSGDDVKSRLRFLTECSGMAAEAASHAISTGYLFVAIEYLEESRALVWRRLLQLRAPFDRLPSPHGERLTSIARRLIIEDLPLFLPSSQSEEIKRRRLIDEFEAELQVVRTLGGMGRFLLPAEFRGLRGAAAEGPVVIVIATANCGHAMVVQSDSDTPLLVALRSTSKDHLTRLNQATAIVRAGARDAVTVTQMQHSEQPTASDDEDSMERGIVKRLAVKSGGLHWILAELWVAIVAPILRALQVQRLAIDRPRLWWVPIGEFTALPLHAAGIYGHAKDQQCASDYVISSYTPTLEALINARRDHTPIDTRYANVLLVAAPDVPGEPPLPMVREEVKTIQDILSEGQRTLPPVEASGDGPGPSVQEVLEALPSAAVVHFACHGEEQSGDALSSGFILQNGTLKISDLMRLTTPNSFFAFLSCCRSATGSKDVPDEAMSLAAAMLFAGFRSIIATQWEMCDVDGPAITRVITRPACSDL